MLRNRLAQANQNKKYRIGETPESVTAPRARLCAAVRERSLLRAVFFGILFAAALMAAVSAGSVTAEASEGYGKLVMIGDSYGLHTNPSWMKMLAARLGVSTDDCRMGARSGYGFAAANRQYISILSTMSADEEVTHVLVCGGYNDRSYNQNSLDSAVSAFTAMAKTKYPNARLCMAFFGWDTRAAQQTLLKGALSRYQTAARKYGWTFLSGPEYVLRKNESSYMKADHIHPTYAGAVQLVNATAAALERFGASSASGLTKTYGEWYYYKNGVVSTDFTGVVRFSGTLFYIQNGHLDKTWSGAILYNSRARTVKNGVVCGYFSGLAKFSGKWYYYTNGLVNTTYKGLAKHSGTWYYVSGGTVASNYTGLVTFSNAAFYVVNGVLDKTLTTVISVNGTVRYVKNGVLSGSFSGLTIVNKKWYYFTKGVQNKTYNSLAKYNGRWYHVQNGTVHAGGNEIVSYAGCRWFVSGGVMQRVTGTVTVGGHQYSVKSGIILRKLA